MGELNRQNVLGKRAYWLLDFEVGAQPWRFATEQLTITSRKEGVDLVYRPGLFSLDFELERENATVQVRATAENTWARSRRRYGPMAGRPFVLRRWAEGLDLEEAWVVLQGVVGSASYADTSDPSVLELSLERALVELSETLPTPDMEIYGGGSGTHAGTNLYTNSPSSWGQKYPIVIGYPGFGGGGNPQGASPSFPIDATSTTAGVDWEYLIAGHRVEAANIDAWDMATSIPTAATFAVLHRQDNLGREIAYFLADGTEIPHEDNREILIGWSPTVGGGGTTGGAGVLYHGSPVLGLGDLLAWGAETWMPGVVIDWGEVAARRPGLNRFSIDTVINEPVNWQSWLESELLDLFEIEQVHGPNGLYWREIQYTADPKDVRARLTTEPFSRGFRVSRQSALEDTDDEILNQISMEYSQTAMSSSFFQKRLTLGPDRTALIGGNATLGGAQDDRLVSSPLCRHSLTWSGLRAKTIKSVLIAQESSALAVLEKKVARHAIPGQLAEYRGGEELADLRKYDTVEIEDTRDGADFRAGTLALVWRFVIEDQGSYRVQLRVPFDPLRDPGTD